MSKTCAQRYSMVRGEAKHISLDWGENTAAQKTGELSAGDTVATCTVALQSSPTGSTTPTLGSVSVASGNASSDDIAGRVYSAGEATTCLVTMLSNQVYGTYVLRFAAVTTNGETLKADTVIDVVP